jgi:hypothetical protein
MSVPQFDPWSDAKRLPTRAYRAYCAYLQPNLGTSGTIGTGAEPTSSASQSDRVHTWERRLWAARLNISAATDMASPQDKLLISAIEFCRGPWAPRLAALGWSECDLFAAADDAGPSGGLIQFLEGRQIRFATSDAVYFSTGRQLTAYVRAFPKSDALPRVWDLPFRR